MSTKTGACIRLIFSLLAAAFLIILLIMGISGMFGFGNFNVFGTRYANADKYSTGNASFPADDLRNIDINWIDGEVIVLPCNGNNIEIEEASDSNLNEDEKVHYYYNEGTLYIQYQKSGRGFAFSSSNKRKKNKSLTLRIPKNLCDSLSDFNLDTVSSRNEISSLSCSDMEIDNVSGETVFTNVRVSNKINFDNVSGDINIQGGFAKLDIDTVSGDCSIDTDITPSSLNLDTVSGDCKLMLPYSAEFCAEHDGVSGKLNIDGFKVTKDDDEYICGNSNNEYDFDTVSGDITISQKEQGTDDVQSGNDNQGNGGSQSGYGSQGNGSSQNGNGNQGTVAGHNGNHHYEDH